MIFAAGALSTGSGGLDEVLDDVETVLLGFTLLGSTLFAGEGDATL